MIILSTLRSTVIHLCHPGHLRIMKRNERKCGGQTWTMTLHVMLNHIYLVLSHHNQKNRRKLKQLKHRTSYGKQLIWTHEDFFLNGNVILAVIDEDSWWLEVHIFWRGQNTLQITYYLQKMFSIRGSPYQIIL